MIIIGIDTAIRCTGYGVVEIFSASNVRILDCGVIKNNAKLPHSACLRRIAGGVRQLTEQFKADAVSIEEAFYSKNPKTTMILSMARGAAITVAAEAGIPVYAYSPKSAKKAAVGSGNASKEQIATVMTSIFSLNAEEIPLDSTDALALALCHGQTAIRPELKMLLPEPI